MIRDEYGTTSASGESSPALCVAPSDFSSIVVRPPRMLPGDGCVPRMSSPSACASLSTRLIDTQQSCGDVRLRRACGEQVFRAHDLGDLAEHCGAHQARADDRRRARARGWRQDRTCSRTRRI